MSQCRALALLAFLAVAACGPGFEDAGQNAPPLSTASKLLRSQHAVPGEYIVVLSEEQGLGVESVTAAASELAGAHGGKVTRTYGHALKGFSVTMTEAQALALAENPRVKYVQENGLVWLNSTQNNATWGLDRVDQRDLPLNTAYSYNASGAGVHAYIIDTGVYQTHQEFAGRIGNRFDAVTPGGTATDCHGHGTHVAGTVGGTTYGLAKSVTLHPVRVLDCQGSGTTAGVVAGVDWVTANRQLPAVANMSLGGDPDQALDDAIARSIAAGVTYAVAAGNESTNACNSSPARLAAAITVGATNNTDAMAWFSNFGTCVDIFAPGQDITSAWSTNNSATNIISGTSMATPHVVGAAALYLERNPTATPQQVRDALVSNGSTGRVINPGTGSPNVLLYTGFIPPPAGGGDSTSPTTSVTAPTAGASLVGTVTLSANASDNVGVTRVEFSVDGVVVGSDTTAPYSLSWDSSTVGNGSHTVRARAFDAAANMGDSAAVAVTTNNPGFATYDATLKAPKCGTVGSRCDSSSLLIGHGPIGPEPNAPNTINNSCADGTKGTYQVDESLEGLRVSTTDGTSFAAGKTVRIEARVWAYSTPGLDSLALYYTANANNPSWQLLDVVTPAAGGLQTLSLTYTLPAGSLQAIRGVYQFFGDGSSCGMGSWDDTDDLIFAVGGGSGDTTPPTTSLTAPSAGSTLSGTVTVSASASDNVGVSKVEFYAGSTLIGTDTASPYSLSWNTSAVANGTYALTSRAYDAAGNTATSATVSVTVSNTSGGGDTTPPTTSLTAPSAGSTLSNTVTVSANASDNVGVSKVEFYAGGTLIDTDTASPYSISWNTSTVANGTYALTSKAYDAAGNTATSSAVSVTVSNSSGGCAITEQLLLNPGFESGNVNWTASSGVIASAANARSGTWRAKLAGKAVPATTTLTQQVSVPATACSVSLKFWMKVVTDEWDSLNAYDWVDVEIRNSSGALLAKLATYSNLDGGAYVQRTFDLAAYKGQTIQISFKATEDDYLQTSFFVDDTSLTITR